MEREFWPDGGENDPSGVDGSTQDFAKVACVPVAHCGTLTAQ